MQEIAPGVFEGGSPVPAVVVVSEVSMYQARRALHAAGKLAAAEAAINALPNPDDRKAAQIAWEFRPTVRRDSALVQQIGAAIGLSEAEMDELFADAAGIT